MTTSRERRLLGAMIASGMLVLVSHTGGPVACSVAAEQVEVRQVEHGLLPGQEPNVVLKGQGGLKLVILQGTLLQIAAAQFWEGTLIGFDPFRREILIAQEDDGVVRLPADQIHTIVLLGGRPTSGYAGNGALIGGLSGAAIGAIAGAAVGGEQWGPLCAVGFGVPALGIGAGLGAGVGAIAGHAQDRPRTELPIGPGAWNIRESPMLGTGAPAPATSPGATAPAMMPVAPGPAAPMQPAAPPPVIR